MHIKEPLLLIGKISCLYGSQGVVKHSFIHFAFMVFMLFLAAVYQGISLDIFYFIVETLACLIKNYCEVVFLSKMCWELNPSDTVIPSVTHNVINYNWYVRFRF